MKKISYVLTVIAIFLLSAPAAFSQSQEGNTKYKEFKIVLNDVNFTVDPRIELYHTIEVVSGMPLVNYIELDYKQKITAYFAPFQQHPLFSYLNRHPLYGKLFNSIDAPMPFLLHLTNDLEWRRDVDFAGQQNPALDSLRLLMKDFALKSGYPKFFNSNADLFNISLATLTYNLPHFDEKNRLLNYCGARDRKDLQFNVILNFLGWGNFGPRIFKKDSGELYAIIAPEKSAIRVPTFDVAALYKLVWHEFAHSFANPAVEKVEGEFDKLNYLWPPVKEAMSAQAYQTWRSVVKEHLTEAIACRMAAQKFGEDAADLNYVRYQKGKGWLYLNPLLKALKYYETNRNKYPTLDSFIPEILACLKAVKPADIDAWAAESARIRTPDVSVIPTVGDIYDQKNLLYIVSSNEPDREADQRLKNFISKNKNSIGVLKDAQIVADTTALKMDLSSYNLLVWGTPEGNRFLQKYLGQIPLLIEKDKIIGENVFEGRGYGVLIGWVNPANPKNVMAVYTGQNPDDLVDFNKMMNGGGNYHIFRNFITLKQGNFSRQGRVWLAK